MLKAIMIGNLGADGVIHEKDGRRKCRLSVAVRKKGANKTDTTWVTVFVTGDNQIDKFVMPNAKKGSLVFVSGHQTLSVYEGKTNVTIAADTIDFLSPPKEETSPYSSTTLEEDEVPF